MAKDKVVDAALALLLTLPVALTVYSSEEWVAVQRSVQIVHNLTTTPLNLKVDTVVGDSKNVDILFFNSARQYVGQLYFEFSSPVSWLLYDCIYWRKIYKPLTSHTENIFTISLNPSEEFNLVVHFNNKKLIDFMTSSCPEKSWISGGYYQQNDIARIEFYKWDTASAFYKLPPNPCEGHESSLICKNGGTCARDMSNPEDYTKRVCACAKGYNGSSCENKLDPEFVRAVLIREVNEMVIPAIYQGLLIVTFVNKQSGEEMNGTVCADNFNWRRANTFCRYLGNEQGEWNSRPNNFNFASKAWLRNNTNGPIKLSDLCCKENEDKTSYCSARILTDCCNYNQSVWLNCANRTDMWNPVVHDKYIPTDLETSYLFLRTDSILRDDDSTLIWYYDEEGEYVGGIRIWFSPAVEYQLLNCQQNACYFPEAPLIKCKEDKEWMIEKRGNRTKVYYDGAQVHDITASSETCDNPYYADTWESIWGRKVSKIGFSSYDTASNSYHIERLWGFERATLIKLVNGIDCIQTDNEGLLIVTIINKQTGVEKNGTVCVDQFDRNSASLFCQSLGFANGWFKEYYSERKEYQLWLENNNMTTLMSDIRCSEDGGSITDCYANMMRQTCDHRDGTWLQCTMTSEEKRCRTRFSAMLLCLLSVTLWD